MKPGKPLTPSCVAALPPPSVNVDSITNDSMSLSFTLNSQYKVRFFFLCFLAGGSRLCERLWWLGFFQVEQYTVILSWQFDTHVKENRNYTVTSGVLKGTESDVLVTRVFFWQCGCWRVLFVSSYKPDSRDGVWGGCVGSHQHRRQPHHADTSADQRPAARAAPPEGQGCQPDSCGVQLDCQWITCSGKTHTNNLIENDLCSLDFIREIQQLKTFQMRFWKSVELKVQCNVSGVTDTSTFEMLKYFTYISSF